MSYLTDKYKGRFRLKTPIDKRTNQFPREYNGQFADSDIYIDCQKSVQVFHYGHGVLQAYIPSLGRGNNIIKAIYEKYGESSIFDIEKTDSEVIFKFKPKGIEDETILSLLQPRTSGANISPFSSKNLPKVKYIIPENDLLPYKEIIGKLPINEMLHLVRATESFLESLTNKKYPMEQLKADMALKCLKGKEYIHSIGKWNEYLKHLEKNL